MHDDPRKFEEEVRRIACFRWPSAGYAGSEIIGGRERDGVFVTEECIHLLECTTSRYKDKALSDLKKLYSLYTEYRKRHAQQAIKCWFITLHEPTADQRACRTEVKGAPPEIFNILSLAQFQAKLVDSFEYLQLRDNHKFGSVYDPKTESVTQIPKYIDVGLRCAGRNESFSIEQLADALVEGKRLVVLGEYGVGKSMMLREIYRTLAKRNRDHRSTKFPVFLNLREHQGQQDPAEVLERHARNVGFHAPNQLVRAWKAGYVVLLLDGFDEVSSLGLQAAWRRLRDARYVSMTGVRCLVRESPTGTGLAVAGREHFFDTAEERRHAIGQAEDWLEIRPDEFTETQIQQLVGQFAYRGDIPPWLPSRPLLLCTLFARGIEKDTASALTVLTDPAAGWNMLLKEVCSREARIEQGISGQNIRSILESLATLARAKDTGLGPFSPQDIISLFQAECGFPPTDEALVVLQRLPGLGRASTGAEDSRCFVDAEFADACRAGGLVRFAKDPFNEKSSGDLSLTKIGVGQTGIGVACLLLGEIGFNSGRLTAAIKAMQKLPVAGAIPADLLQVAVMLGLTIEQPLLVSGLLFDRMELASSTVDFTNVNFVDCYFFSLELAPDVTAANCPLFTRCMVQEVDGRISSHDLPAGRFSDCIFESFMSPTGGTSGALNLGVPAGVQVLVSALKKLFVQSLSGRKENAFFRGLDEKHQIKVLPILALLKRSGLAQPGGRAGDPVWHPVRWQRSRVLAILEAPSTSQDPVIVEARKL